MPSLAAPSSCCSAPSKLSSAWLRRNSPASVMRSSTRTGLANLALAFWPVGLRIRKILRSPTVEAAGDECRESSCVSVQSRGVLKTRSLRLCTRVPGISLLSRARLTAPSKGRLASGPSLTSNVGQYKSRRMPRRLVSFPHHICCARCQLSSTWQGWNSPASVQRSRTWSGLATPAFASLAAWLRMQKSQARQWPRSQAPKCQKSPLPSFNLVAC